MRRLLSYALCSALFAACGSSDGSGQPGADASDGPGLGDAGASADGAVVQCEGDHQESDEARNDRLGNESGQAEATGLTLTRQGDVRICGEINPAQASGELADVDVYEFEVVGTQSARIELVADQGALLSGFELALFRADGPSYMATGIFSAGHALIGSSLPAGTYWVAVLAHTPVPEQSIAYHIDLRAESVDCAQAAGDADYLEASDGTDSRGNDSLTVTHGGVPEISATTANDAAEATELTIGATPLAIDGSSANVPALDDYHDRDAYLVHTGPQNDELALRLSWDHGSAVDFDVRVVAVDTLSVDISAAGAAHPGRTVDEHTAMAVVPDQDYLVWVGLYDDDGDETLPQSYRLSLCGN